MSASSKLYPFVAGVAIAALVACGDQTTDTKPKSAGDPKSTKATELRPSTSPATAASVQFPSTPSTTIVSLAASPETTQLTDLDLSRTFAAASGTAWNQALLEIGRRRTPALIRLLTEHIDDNRGVSVLSGEAMYAPELNYPIARTLIDCGEQTITDLVRVGSSGGTLKKRVLAARVLMQLHSQGLAGADPNVIETLTTSTSARETLREAFGIAADAARSATVVNAE